MVIAALSIAVGILGGFVAQGLTRLIGLVTNISFYGRLSSAFVSPADHRLGPWVVLVPVLGGVIVGIMARFGSKAIRGHGIPEAMEQVLTNRSRIPARLTILKPLSAAISIGTGGPFGAEGPIIATGGALGSLVGQWMEVSAMERKTLLAAGAAAGMAATFGSPVSAVLLAVELLLFEYRPRSLIPVAMAAAAAAAVRITFLGMAPIFPMPGLSQPSGGALATYVVLGAVVGLASVAVTRAVYAVEDQFEKLPIHWMWWPAVGGVAVGAIGLIAPHTMGVGYDNIENIVSGRMATTGLIVLCGLKLISWMISLGSGTSGGTLAPLFTIGGGLGAGLGALVIWIAPRLGVDVRIAALVGMAAMFAWASRALLTSVVFAFETTRQPIGLLPLLGGCCSAFLVSWLSMPTTIMTEKIVRRGVRVLGEYSADFLEQVAVRASSLRPVVTLRASDTVEGIRGWLAGGGSHHQGFPVLDAQDQLVGVVTRRDLFDAGTTAATVGELVRRAPIVIHDDSSLREAAERMAHARIGRLPVVSRAEPLKVIGIVTRSDLVEANNGLMDQHRREAPTRPRFSSLFSTTR
ncbi:MAG TPA: chloride channel protein [Polyangiaceae bacterium]|nr:chloride channel protein [Polyangiaceae bacterium]